MSQIRKPADFVRLRELVNPKVGSDAELLIDQLLLSDRIYRPYYDTGMAERSRAFFASGRDREQNMKHLFLRGYRRAEERDGSMPRVLVKAGHWHIAYGRYHQSQLLTLGNFLAEFATSHDQSSVSIAVFVFSGTEAWRTVAGRESFRPFERAMRDPESWTLIDLRAARYLWSEGPLKQVSEGVRRTVFSYDFMLVLTGADAGTYHIVEDG